MTTRERRLDTREAMQVEQAVREHSPESVPRETGDRFLEAADAAIERALSGTAEAFLNQNRQLGGQ